MAGMKFYRGEREIKRFGEYDTDPGDFGRGIYYTTSRARAKCYGTVKAAVVRLENPLVLDMKRAYDLGAGLFNTIGNNPSVDEEMQLKKCERLTRFLLKKGFDGLVSVNHGGKRMNGWHTVLELVDYRPYRIRHENEADKETEIVRC